MFRIMRREKYQISDEEVVLLLEKCEYGVLSTIAENGFPYGVPLSYAYKDGVIYFHCAQEGMKLDNIALNNKVSFCVVGEVENVPEKFTTKYESVIVFGSAKEVFHEEKVEGLMSLINKYSKDYANQGKKYINNNKEETAVYKIEIEYVTGKARR